MSKQIFISYSRADTNFVSGLINDLTNQGLNIWLDQRNIAAGQRWDNTIQQALQACDTFVIVLSPNSVASENVLDELSYAINADKRIIPALYRDCELPYRIARVQFVDFRSDYQIGFQHLFSEITQQAPQRPVKAKKPDNGRQTVAWLLGLFLAFMFCAALGIGGYMIYPYIFATDVPATPFPSPTPPPTSAAGLPTEVGPTMSSPLDPTPTLAAPHAPAIENTYGVQLYDEKQQLITVQPGEQYKLAIMDMWSAPEGAAPSCASGFMALTWIVREPYPTGGEDLQLLRMIPMGDGRTEVFASGAQGSISIGYCEEIFLFNTSLQAYRLEIRYASGMNQ